MIQKAFRERVISTVLHEISMHSERAENLLFAIAMHESAGLKYLLQVRGPAMGVYQIEPATHRDILENGLGAYRADRTAILRRYAISPCLEDDINLLDLRYATALARFHFARFPAPIPEDVAEIGEYAKLYWNGPGKAKGSDYASALERWR